MRLACLLIVVMRRRNSPCNQRLWEGRGMGEACQEAEEGRGLPALPVCLPVWHAPSPGVSLPTWEGGGRRVALLEEFVCMILLCISRWKMGVSLCDVLPPGRRGGGECFVGDSSCYYLVSSNLVIPPSTSLSLSSLQ